jgi:inhibitor of cysteine peptidase
MKDNWGGLRMHASVLVAILAVFAMTALSGCSSQTAPTLGAEDSGGEVTVQKGQTLTIELKANPSTGYSWQFVESKGAILKQLGEPEFEAESDLLGAPGMQTLRFEAVEAGQMELRLVYRRPWETDVEPVETFTLIVTVR